MKASLLATIKEALTMKEASVKRAQNTNKSPKFAPVYEAELAEVREAQAWAAKEKAD